ncbi:hypothetical protein M438DRAFT_345967 [Aureobasidium pullulans EXF-150]|uniref:Uncharacterized protein n=1 Tax=Aureobasidium pullulans EXF-150 TaxID=1043002 RepID=A0A074YAI9_AURPU|nr:uncharacterized protein M438DRAFT_345967 [Aureobasidium pullulans EXF-150]KEQ83876.1 hypothetical protein M438DRAFT_345967 [Aureobasidium pullulans EXF-150]
MPPSPWASGCTTPHNCPRDTTIEVTPGCYKVHYNIAAFSEAQENVADPPADVRSNITSKAHSNLKKEEAVLVLHKQFPRVVKVDYGNDKIAYETLAIGYNDKPMQSETGDGGMFYWLNVEGMTVGYCLTVELIRDSPKHWPAHKTPPVAELFEHWKEQFRSMSWVALAYQGDGGGVLQRCSQYSQTLAQCASLSEMPADFVSMGRRGILSYGR